MKATECSECRRVLFYGEDDIGDDDENPLCEDCQMAEAELAEYRFEHDFEAIKRYAGYRGGLAE